MQSKRQKIRELRYGSGQTKLPCRLPGRSRGGEQEAPGTVRDDKMCIRDSGMGTCCVSGCGDINMDEENKKFTLGGKEYHEGDAISLDGSTGNIYDGIIPTVDATIAGEFGRIMGWADKYRTMKVRTNADTPADAKKARELGAEGIGLCRTEHMFFEGNRIDAFREMICSETVEEREAALAKILPEQQGDFEKLYEALEGLSLIHI